MVHASVPSQADAAPRFAARAAAAPNGTLALASTIGNRAFARLLARQQAAALQTPAATPKPEMPTCEATAVDAFIADPQSPKNDLFGITELTGAGGTQPEFKTAPSGNGVAVERTGASIPPIKIRYLRPGRYVDKNRKAFLGSRGYPSVWDVTQAGSARILAGEQEHCLDYQYAFYLSLYRFAEIVNEMADAGTVFKDHAEARKALDKRVFIDPQNLPAYFRCLCEWTRKERDGKGWHEPRARSQEHAEYDSALGKEVAVLKLTPAALPQVGKHGTGELLMQAAASASCLTHTRLKL